MGRSTQHLVLSARAAFRLLHRHFLSDAPLVRGPEHSEAFGLLQTPVALQSLIDPSLCRGWEHEKENLNVQKHYDSRFISLLQPTFSYSSLISLSRVISVKPPALGFPLLHSRQSDLNPRQGLKLGFQLQSGMILPGQHEDVDLEASSVKRKRKKKMNKHKQRKLRRRDRHRN